MVLPSARRISRPLGDDDRPSRGGEPALPPPAPERARRAPGSGRRIRGGGRRGGCVGGGLRGGGGAVQRRGVPRVPRRGGGAPLAVRGRGREPGPGAAPWRAPVRRGAPPPPRPQPPRRHARARPGPLQPPPPRPGFRFRRWPAVRAVQGRGRRPARLPLPHPEGARRMHRGDVRGHGRLGDDVPAAGRLRRRAAAVPAGRRRGRRTGHRLLRRRRLRSQLGEAPGAARHGAACRGAPARAPVLSSFIARLASSLCSQTHAANSAKICKRIQIRQTISYMYIKCIQPKRQSAKATVLETLQKSKPWPCTTVVLQMFLGLVSNQSLSNLTSTK